MKKIGILRFKILSLGILLLSSSSFSQESMDITEVVSAPSQDSAPSREDVFKEVSQRVSIRFIREIIGDVKFERHRSMIQSKIINQADRFIPLLKNTPFTSTPDGKVQTVVTGRLMVSDLRALLLKEGLLSSSEGIPSVLPLVAILDRVNAKSYRWWIPDALGGVSVLQEQSAKMLSTLRQEFNEKGFYVENPVVAHLKDMIPPPFVSDNFKTEDLSFLGDYFGVDIVVLGRITFLNSESFAKGHKMAVEMQAVQASTGQVVAEVARSFDITGGAWETSASSILASGTSELSKDLSQQILDVWQKGALGSSVMLISLKGNFEFKDIEKVKADAARVSEIKFLRERRLSRDEMLFEAGTVLSLPQLAERLKKSILATSFSVSESGSEIVLKKR